MTAGKRQSQRSLIQIETIYIPGHGTKTQITILKLQIISKLQILMTKTIQSLIGCLALFYLF
jgi:hypothetical protein